MDKKTGKKPLLGKKKVPMRPKRTRTTQQVTVPVDSCSLTVNIREILQALHSYDDELFPHVHQIFGELDDVELSHTAGGDHQLKWLERVMEDEDDDEALPAKPRRKPTSKYETEEDEE